MNENVAQIFAKSNRQLPGVTAQDCDRALVISGGVDASNNHKRYENNVKASFSKLKSLGFSDEQISVFYNNGSAINVDEGGSNTNVTDFPTTKEGLIAYFKGLALIMQGSCTLTILVTDHGTGFDPTRNYKGARPALLGTEAATGTSFSESDVKFDGRSKTYRTSTNFRYRGKIWFFAKDENGDIELYQRDGDKWVLKGENGNGDNIISETELGGFDINGDGDTTDTNFGISVAWLEAKPANTRKHQDNAWDSDGDGTDDVRLRWDGTRYVSERLDQGTWKEMGRNTDGDFIIDSTDGGSDWDLDGDKGGKVGFHEGINLWGSEVLWDDELAEMLKPLSKMGIHIMMAMNSCYSGGFLKNLEGIVENIYAGSSEDTVNYSRYNSDRTQIYAADFLEFLDKLDGIDTDSWNAATDAAIAEDDLVATGNEATKNIHSHGQTQRHETSSIYQVESETGEYTIQLDLPDDLVGQIYDFEFILGLQNPRWSNVSFPSGLPSGLETELAPGGVRVFSSDPIEDNITLKIKVSGATVDDNIRIEYTDRIYGR
jgi:hypothetical protein